MSKMDRWFRKHDPRSRDNQLKRVGFVLSKDDRYPLVVLRPKEEDVAEILAKVDALVGKPHEEAKPAFDALLADYPHQFIGYVGSKGEILNGDGVEIEAHMRPGDSMSSGPMFQPPACMRGAAA